MEPSVLGEEDVESCNTGDVLAEIVQHHIRIGFPLVLHGKERDQQDQGKQGEKVDDGKVDGEGLP